MLKRRVTEHPILTIEKREQIPFYWNKQKLTAHKGEMISSALFANGIDTFGHHIKDGSPQGIYCANGQCAQCTVIANGIPVKACMTKVEKNMVVQSCDDLPELPKIKNKPVFHSVDEHNVDVLIIGGGPSGLSASLELGKYQLKTLLVDDKHKLGGKLVLQTHKFFGSIEDCYAGTRGIEIGEMLANELEKYPSIEVWHNSTALYVFSDKKVGVLRGNQYHLVIPKIILNAAGAREKSIAFPGNTLPGVYGAGAFQTLVNRDLVKPCEKLFIIGGGNVGLIAGYHALQAGISVVGLAEAMPKCGGYKVHEDKLKRLGVPIYTSHSVLSANGKERVESITIVQVDEKFQPIIGTEKTFVCDTILVAVGLNSINEFYQEAQEAGMDVYATGDAQEIAEASSAMFNGKIAGLKIAKRLGVNIGEIPETWSKKAEILKSPPGKIYPREVPNIEQGVIPILNCVQEIPCNPCAHICPFGFIKIKGDPIIGLPYFEGKCTGCGLCLTICPGLAITLVDYRKDKEFPIVSIPYEVQNHKVVVGDKVKVVDMEGNYLDTLEVVSVQQTKRTRKTQIIKVKSTREIAKQIAGIRIQSEEITKPLPKPIIPKINDDVIICRCERVTAGEIRKWIKKGITDMNQLKELTYAGMGACGSKTCEPLILRLYQEEGIPLDKITYNTKRPLLMEVPLGRFVNEGIDSTQKNTD